MSETRMQQLPILAKANLRAAQVKGRAAQVKARSAGRSQNRQLRSANLCAAQVKARSAGRSHNSQLLRGYVV